MTGLWRRNLTLIAGVALSAIVAGRAAAANFIDYAFPATGASASRNDPDRWADWKNVKEFGAVGGGVIADRAPIQRCVDSIVNIIPGALGTVYFPPGTFRTFGAIT